MPALGLEVPKADIDELFNSWDKDGGGSLAYKELKKILATPHTGLGSGVSPPSMTAAASKVGGAAAAAAKLGALGKGKAAAKGGMG